MKKKKQSKRAYTQAMDCPKCEADKLQIAVCGDELSVVCHRCKVFVGLFQVKASARDMRGVPLAG